MPGHGGPDSGIVANGHEERHLVAAHAWHLADLLRKRGSAVYCAQQATATGAKEPYAARVRFANEKKAVALSLHFNGGGGRYGLVKYHETNPQSEILAGHLARRYGELFAKTPGLVSDVRVEVLKSRQRGSVCIRGVQRSCVLAEPLFLDNDAHAAWLRDRANRIALSEAVAGALEDLAVTIIR
jgi:N-acetylmuramoyl-L-alanine amidase